MGIGKPKLGKKKTEGVIWFGENYGMQMGNLIYSNTNLNGIATIVNNKGKIIRQIKGKMCILSLCKCVSAHFYTHAVLYSITHYWVVIGVNGPKSFMMTFPEIFMKSAIATHS